MFEQIRQKIDYKEREILSHLDEVCLRDQNQMESYVRLIKGRSANLTEIE